MKEGYVEFANIADAMVSEDGEEATLVCRAPDGGEFDMRIPANAIRHLIDQLTALSISPQLKTSKSAEPPLFEVIDLEAIINPQNNALIMTMENRTGHRFRAGFYPEHTKRLYELLFREGKFDNEAPIQ